MKKKTNLMLVLLLVLTSVSVYSQNDSVYIQKQVDEMTDKSYAFASRRIVCIDEVNKRGFNVSFFMDVVNGKCSTSDLQVKTVRIGTCNENNTIVFLFEDGTKLSLKSWNKFNCDGDSWFRVTDNEKERLSTIKIKKIMVQNGRSYESYTHELKEDQDYFIQLGIAVQKQKVKLIKD